MLAKRILGILMGGAMSYLAYIKITDLMGDSEYGGMILILLLLVLFMLFFVVRKIVMY